ncbi:ATP-binding cassette domain-containing protein [Stenotrophomonas sp. CD2]|nr:ATP-binding cassette domain-containing protein [Stenotrophomonas sp. CD2]
MALNATVRQFNGAPQLEPAQTMVAINKVTMSFGEFTAVRDVDIRVGNGEFLAIVGPTGCGKSTILNSVAGLLKPSCGQVSIDGRAVSGVQESVGYLFQQDALLPWKTAFQNVELGLRFRGVAEAERKAKANALAGQGWPDRIRASLSAPALRWPAQARADGAGTDRGAEGDPDG